MRYSLGLDIGISSVGWAVLNLDKHRIEDLGVRAFSAAENAKDKSPLAEPRRLARSARRRLRRRAGRMRRVRDLFVRYGLLTSDELQTAFITSNDKPDPWQLRARGLDHLLSAEEFARALFHIVKRRGFKSNRKHDTSKEDGKMLAAIRENQRKFSERDYRTVGEMMCLDPDFAAHKRNKADAYTNTVQRSLLEDEIKTLFEAQRKLGSSWASSEFESDLLAVFAWQMPFASGDRVLGMVGPCTFEPEERRASRACWTAERFRLLCDLNSCTLIINGSREFLTRDEKQILEAMAYEQAQVTYKQIRKKLDLPEDARFSKLRYTRRKSDKVDDDLDCEKAVFCKLTGFYALRKAFESADIWDRASCDCDLLDDVAFACTFYKTDEDIRRYLADRDVNDAVIEAALKTPGFSGVMNLSVKAMRNIIPHLEEGLIYSEACEAAGYSHFDPKAEVERGTKLPPIGPNESRNPVVRRALSQARRVVNAIVQKHGTPTYVHVEFARDVGRTAEERDKARKRMEENRAANQEDRERFEEIFGREPKGDAMVRWRLYRDQNGQCAYSQKPLDHDRLFEPGYAEIDHILPHSRSFDDSLANRVLVLCEENRHKRDRTPWEWFGSDDTRWAHFEGWVKANIRDGKKKSNLLMRDFGKRQEEWFDRNLNDTRWITKSFADYVRRHLSFADPEISTPVVCLNGFVVALQRGLWGLAKVREENDLHHAMDAAVIASLTQGRIQMITKYSQAQETGCAVEIVDPETGETWEVVGGRKFSFPQPWKGFRKEVEARLSDDPAGQIAALNLPAYADNPPELRPVMVSRMRTGKNTGAIHAETIRSAREEDGKRTSVTRKKLVDLKLSDLDNLYAPETNEKLYEAIRQRMAEHNNNAKKAFQEEFRKPTNDPAKPGPIVRSVKVAQSQPSGVPVRGGIADNGGMSRVDVFTKGGKFYLVPVYVSDIMAGRLPNRAISGESEDQWLIVDDTYTFLFALRPYDLVRVVAKKDREFTGYYRKTNRSDGTIEMSCPKKNDPPFKSFGARNLLSMEKYYVGVLGDVHRVPVERRVGVANGIDIQPGEAEGR